MGKITRNKTAYYRAVNTISDILKKRMCSFPPPAIINLKQSGSNLKSNCFENLAPALVSQFDSTVGHKTKDSKDIVSIGSKTG